MAGSRKTTELAAFKVKFCSHPLCCRIRFPLFSEGQRPWKHLWLSRSPEPASSSSAGQGITSQPPLSTQMARSTKLKRGMERDDQCLQKKGCRELNPSHPFFLKSHERQEGLHCTCPEIIPCKTFRPQAKASWISMSCSQKLPAGR